MKGRISGNTVTIERDCRGQGYEGPCNQVYTGKLNGDVIEGSFTLNGRTIGTWTLYLDSVTHPEVSTEQKDSSDTEGVYEPVAGLANLLVSGTYRVNARVSQHFPSTWTLKVSNGRISGKSKWHCCPGPRIDPMKGRISGNTVTIERDCRGQGYEGPCNQVYTGKLNGNVIEGSFTLNGRTIGTWTLYLDSVTHPEVSTTKKKQYELTPGYKIIEKK
ncbi:MAG: hypothetical protein P9M03_03020, partial [Candidatus Theseobacter exili]|nr:hypothetical protein [Candidatus Theseobacter exili]